MANIQRANHKDISKGDNRTPDKTIGQVKYADHHGDQTGEKIGSDKTSAKTSEEKSQNAQKSQNEGPAAYAPHEDEPTRPKGADR
jgi:hypothetical protein